jgi:hypothetical protein
MGKDMGILDHWALGDCRARRVRYIFSAVQ